MKVWSLDKHSAVTAPAVFAATGLGRRLLRGPGLLLTQLITAAYTPQLLLEVEDKNLALRRAHADQPIRGEHSRCSCGTENLGDLLRLAGVYLATKLAQNGPAEWFVRAVNVVARC